MPRPRLVVAVSAAVLVALTALAPVPNAWGRRAPGGPRDISHKDFDRRNFPEDPRVDNRFLPLVPGTQFILEGRAIRGGAPLPHRVVFTVTDLEKVVNGVHTIVLWDRDISEGQVVEAELAFHAQDKDGNVWNLGEYPEEFENGKFIGAPSTWIAGVAGAEAGIAMRARPRVGSSPYIQGSAPAIDFLDQGKVVRQNQTTCVPVRCFQNVLVVDETNLAEPGEGHQLKFHAPGVGVVRVAPGAGSTDQESLVLIRIRRLGPKEMDRVRAEALRLDRRAYRVSPLYRHTPPAKRIDSP
jgi:hypothetical protein